MSQPKTNLKLETKVYQINPRDLLPLERNARYMTGEQLARLAKNIEQDGGLTSVPLVYIIPGNTKPTILSGNHRVKGAIAANTDLIWIMEILTPLTEERQIAIALSHNAIAGQDDKTILLELFSKITDLDTKAYSGLTDDDLKDFEPLDLSGLSTAGVQYEEVSLLFLPEDADTFTKATQHIAKSSKASALAGSYGDFNDFFDALVAVKDIRNITNNAIALRVMAGLAVERLLQIEDDADAEVTVDG